MASDAAEIARELTGAGYAGLFMAGERSAAAELWRGGENRSALEEVIRDDAHGDLAALLASEVLLREQPDAAQAVSSETLARVYSRALALTGVGDGPIDLSGNEWGFMYQASNGGDAHGALGPRLLEAGPAAVPYLTALLDDPRRILYMGSKEATVGNALGYRVKDAAAYYLGEIAGIPVPFHEEPEERDAEIDRLKAAVADRA